MIDILTYGFTPAMLPADISVSGTNGTPGMRQLGMWDSSDGIEKIFSDIEQYFGKCRFSDCTHSSEPGCAIKSALAGGGLTRERWENYLKIKHEAKYADDKIAFMRDRQQQHKKWERESRKRDRNKK